MKVYIAEPRERLVFARGTHKLFRNVAKTITGTSAVGAGTAVITGVIGVLMIVIGGRSILGGTMTLGDFVAYRVLRRAHGGAARADRIDRHAGE